MTNIKGPDLQNFLNDATYFFTTHRGVYNFADLSPTPSLRPLEPQSIGPQLKGDQLMGSQRREAYRMGPSTRDLQPNDISLYESLSIEF